MHPFFHHPAVRRFRIIFRWCRICLWMVLLLAVAAVSYLYLTGLPDFLKQPTLRQLLVRGLEAQFSNMQLVWGRGPSILVENSAFSRAGLPLSPRLTYSRAELELDWKALLHGRLEFRSLLVSGAQLQLPVSQAAGDVLLLNNVSLDMQFSQGDVVRLNRCRGTFRGIQTDLIGMLSHAGEVRRWRLPTEIGKTNETFESRLRLVARTLEKIQFTGTPVLRIEAGADGRDMNSFHVELNFDAPSAHTPWGDATDLSVDAACARLMESSHQSFLQVGCTASAMTTPWARSGKMFFLATFSHAANSNLEAQIELDATQFKAPLSAGGSNWVGAAQLSWSGTANLAPTNFMPLLAAGKLHAVEPESPWGSARQMSLEGRAAPAPGLTPPAGGWGPLAGFVPWSLNGQVEISKLASPKLSVDHLSISGHWRAPEVVIERVRGELYGGHADASGAFEADSRELRFVGTTDFNPHSVSQLLNPSVSNWLAQLDWTTPPKINAQMRIVLPPWTNRSPTWVSDVDSSLQLAGDFSVGQSSFDRVPASSAAGHVTYTNRVWDVSHLHALRPEGDVFMDYRSGPRDYHYLIESRLDPKAVAATRSSSGNWRLGTKRRVWARSSIRAPASNCPTAPSAPPTQPGLHQLGGSDSQRMSARLSLHSAPILLWSCALGPTEWSICTRR